VCTPIILATWETEVGGSSPGNVSKKLKANIKVFKTKSKRTWGIAEVIEQEDLSSILSITTNKQKISSLSTSQALPSPLLPSNFPLSNSGLYFLVPCAESQQRTVWLESHSNPRREGTVGSNAELGARKLQLFLHSGGVQVHMCAHLCERM
jgi:hypothetical protein